MAERLCSQLKSTTRFARSSIGASGSTILMPSPSLRHLSIVTSTPPGRLMSSLKPSPMNAKRPSSAWGRTKRATRRSPRSHQARRRGATEAQETLRRGHGSEQVDSRQAHRVSGRPWTTEDVAYLPAHLHVAEEALKDLRKNHTKAMRVQRAKKREQRAQGGDVGGDDDADDTVRPLDSVLALASACRTTTRG